MLRAAASIETQIVYSSRQEIIESSGSEGLQPLTNIYLVLRLQKKLVIYKRNFKRYIMHVKVLRRKNGWRFCC